MLSCAAPALRRQFASALPSEIRRSTNNFLLAAPQIIWFHRVV
jgi:hypothetical protein